MVHAESSNFSQGVTKQEAYDQVLQQAEALFDGQRNWVCNLANTASLLWHAFHSLPEPGDRVNWTGFYVLDAGYNVSKPREAAKRLILGPFMGKVACQTILFGKGVCGSAAEGKRPVLVKDVEEFPGHIACDDESASEIVVPIFDHSSEVIAIIDIDCAVKNGFDEVDEENLVRLAALLGKSCDW